jgi:hypothetical protein
MNACHGAIPYVQEAGPRSLTRLPLLGSEEMMFLKQFDLVLRPYYDYRLKKARLNTARIPKDKPQAATALRKDEIKWLEAMNAGRDATRYLLTHGAFYEESDGRGPRRVFLPLHHEAVRNAIASHAEAPQSKCFKLRKYRVLAALGLGPT